MLLWNAAVAFSIHWHTVLYAVHLGQIYIWDGYEREFPLANMLMRQEAFSVGHTRPHCLCRRLAADASNAGETRLADQNWTRHPQIGDGSAMKYAKRDQHGIYGRFFCPHTVSKSSYFSRQFSQKPGFCGRGFAFVVSAAGAAVLPAVVALCCTTRSCIMFRPLG